jgi:nucleotide-binding universal stress UspA family protein
MYRDLLVHVDGSDAGRRRVRFAVKLASHLGAKLTGLHVSPPAAVPYSYKPSQVAEGLVNAARQLAIDARRAARTFREETDGHPDKSSWLEVRGDVVQGISNYARYTDLVILGQYEHQAPTESHPLPVAHSVLLKCGRPVLVLPALAEQATFARAVLAWDGSREAVRAIHDALPLLRLSASVQIIKLTRIESGTIDNDTTSLAEHLTRHDVTVEPSILQSVTKAEHDRLREQIEQGRYDLLVMGGYSHPVWLEFVFGGATESILGSSKIPVLVSH